MSPRDLEDKNQLNEERKKWTLSPEEEKKNIEEVFQELVTTGAAKPTDNPTMVMVGGQSGSGKSMLVSYYLKNLNGGAIVIDQDSLRLKHPRYTEIYNSYTEREEFLLLKRYLDSLINGIVNIACNSGYNVILESALRSVDKFITLMQNVVSRGYKTELAILAINPEEANLSMFIRYCEYLEANFECRRNTRIDNDSVKKIPENIEKLNRINKVTSKNEPLMDQIIVYTRGNEESGFLPTKRYSREENNNMSPSEAYNKLSTEQTIPSMKKREIIEWIKSTLEKFNEKQVLSNFNNNFNKWEKTI